MACVITDRFGNLGGLDVMGALHLSEQVWGSPPRVLFSDRGSEFSNSSAFTYCNFRNDIDSTSPVRTPASNGLLKRHHGILKQISHRLAHGNRANLQDNFLGFCKYFAHSGSSY